MSIAAGMKHEGREIKTVKNWKIEDAIVNSVSQALPSLPKSPSPTFTWKSFLWSSIWMSICNLHNVYLHNVYEDYRCVALDKW